MQFPILLTHDGSYQLSSWVHCLRLMYPWFRPIMGAHHKHYVCNEWLPGTHLLHLGLRETIVDKMPCLRAYAPRGIRTHDHLITSREHEPWYATWGWGRGRVSVADSVILYCFSVHMVLNLDKNQLIAGSFPRRFSNEYFHSVTTS